MYQYILQRGYRTQLRKIVLLQKTLYYLFLRKFLPISVQYSPFHMKKNTSKPLLGRQLISECPNIWQPLIVYRTQYDDMRCVFGRNQYKCQLYTLSTCYYCYLERKNYWYISGIIFMLHIIKYNKIQVYKHQSIFESLYNVGITIFDLKHILLFIL